MVGWKQKFILKCSISVHCIIVQCSVGSGEKTIFSLNKWSPYSLFFKIQIMWNCVFDLSYYILKQFFIGTDQISKFYKGF